MATFPDPEALSAIATAKVKRAYELRDLALNPGVSLSASFTENATRALAAGIAVDWTKKDRLVDLLWVAMFTRAWSTFEGLIMELACAGGISWDDVEKRKENKVTKGKGWVLRQEATDPSTWHKALNAPRTMAECLSARPEWKPGIEKLGTTVFANDFFTFGGHLRNAVAHRDGLPDAAYLRSLRSGAGKIFDGGRAEVKSQAPETVSSTLSAWELLTRPIHEPSLGEVLRGPLSDRDRPVLHSGAAAYAILLPWAMEKVAGVVGADLSALR